MKKNGFTIVELAVVLVIIGLIVGAILGGQSVIENSKRTAMISDLSDYKSAYDQFKDKYFGLPGDLSDATSYWSTASNGDGDGNVETGGSEDLQAWMHLGFSGLIDGTFSGTTSGASSTAIEETDVPSGPVSGSVYTFYSQSTGVTTTIASVQAGAFRTGKVFDKGTLSPQDSSSIDSKIDNGNPSMGQIITTSGNGIASTNCVTAGGAGDADDTYTLTNNKTDCILIYYLEQVTD